MWIKSAVIGRKSVILQAKSIERKSMIVNSHYVPLQSPYPIIYCNGEMGMQTGTFIVVEGYDPSAPHRGGRMEPPYAMRTHSHPVVSYGNKYAAELTDFSEPNDWSEGIVWDKAEMRDVTILCYDSKPEIPHPKLDMLVSGSRYKDAYQNRETFNLSKLMQQFRKFNIQLSLAEMFKGVQLAPEVKVTFIKQTPNNVFLYGLTEGYAPYLNVLLRWSDDLDKMEKTIRNQIDDYRTAIAPHVIHFSFDSRLEEWKPIAEHLNIVYSQL